MLKYIGKRLLLFIPTILIISVVIFFIIQLPPGDYASSYAAAMAAEGEILTPEQIQDLRVQFGLDKPWYVQYFIWMTDIITKGDFGYSFEYGRDVWAVIGDYLPLTLAISFIILVFQYAVSLPIGIYCAGDPDKARELCRIDAEISHSRDGIWGAQMVAVAVAMAMAASASSCAASTPNSCV